jgi:hypothetical protein
MSNDLNRLVYLSGEFTRVVGELDRLALEIAAAVADARSITERRLVAVEGFGVAVVGPGSHIRAATPQEAVEWQASRVEKATISREPATRTIPFPQGYYASEKATIARRAEEAAIHVASLEKMAAKSKGPKR